ncbi:YceI family protein [Poseidonocella sp. HB161398]|uniref:YceI family protein n=1 Tax=Poseidonocella sp. HB161398 TaxID=2320855 RepID=UPI001109F520|nr:YceI family protein [Poseidonocella sp. HB161398]
MTPFSAVLSAALLLPCAVFAWDLDPDASAVSYVSMKNGDVAEANSFSSLSGSVSETGTVTVDINLASVETGIDIRNQRVRDLLFKVDVFPKATVTAEVDLEALGQIAPGAAAKMELPLSLSVNGTGSDYASSVLVTRAGEDRVVVASLAPVIVDAGELDFPEGLAKLRELAGLDSIQPVVPVSFVLSFTR